MNRTDLLYVLPDKEEPVAVNDMESLPTAPAEGESDDPLQSSSDVDMLRRVRDLLTEAP